MARYSFPVPKDEWKWVIGEDDERLTKERYFDSFGVLAFMCEIDLVKNGYGYLLGRKVQQLYIHRDVDSEVWTYFVRLERKKEFKMESEIKKC